MDLTRLKIDRGSTPERAPVARARARVRLPLGKLLVLGAIVGAGILFHEPALRFIDRYRLPEVTVVEVVRRDPAAAAALSGAAANGYVIARVKAALSADTPGRIVELNVVEGQTVPKGFIVARLFADEYEAALRAAEADVAVATESLGRERAGLENSKADRTRLAAVADSMRASISEWEAEDVLWTLETARVRELVESGAENQKLLDQAEAALQSAKSRVISAKARTAAAEAELTQGDAMIVFQQRAVTTAEAQVTSRAATRDEAAARLDKTIIRAPFDGIVVLKDAEIGEVVSPNVQAGGNARGSVATMVDFASLEMQADVPERSIGRVQVGEPATIYLDAYPTHAYSAIVDRIWPTANKQKGAIEVRSRFLAPDEKLRPEMTCRVVFGVDAGKPPADGSATTPSVETTDSTPSTEDVLVVPADAVVRIDGRAVVYVLERDVVDEREVDLGKRLSDLVVVTRGVAEGEFIVIDPPASVHDGSRVRRKKSN